MKKKVVIIGGGFGGLNAAKKLKNADVDITLIDKTNHHLFQPLLYQVATAALSPGDIATPIRGILNNQKNVSVIMGEVTNIDTSLKKIFLDKDEFSYDYLIVAIGSRHSYFGKNEWEKYAPGLKTISDALSLREKILLSFEKAERSKTTDDVNRYTTFVIVGGGPTGVELAGAIAEISRKALLKDFRNINPANAKIILVEAEDRILTTYTPSLSEKAKQALSKLGVEIMLNTRVNDITAEGVSMNGHFMHTHNVIWAAGNQIPSLIKTLNTETDRVGHVIVKPDLTISNHPEIFIIGDAALSYKNGEPLPGIAPVAIQQGKYAAKMIKYDVHGIHRKPFNYFDKGNLATIGRLRAVMESGRFKISGFPAWVAWVFIHILYLISYRNRYKVLSEWIWYYLTYKQGVRLITHDSKFN